MIAHMLTHLTPSARRQFIGFQARQLEHLADLKSGATADDFDQFARMLKILEQQHRQASDSRAFSALSEARKSRYPTPPIRTPYDEIE